MNVAFIHRVLLAIAACPALALGHPGHGGEEDPQGVAHYLLDPLHAGGLLLAVAAFVLTLILRRPGKLRCVSVARPSRR